jgi:drug/metabolite transporter (DMT)-like permease
MDGAYLIGKIVADGLRQQDMKHRLGLSVMASLLGAFIGTLAVAFTDQFTGLWKVHPWGNLRAVSMALLIAAGIGLLKGWRESVRTG